MDEWASFFHLGRFWICTRTDCSAFVSASRALSTRWLAWPGAPAAARLPVSRVTMEIEDDDDAAAARWPSSFKRRHLLQFLLHASKVSTIPCLSFLSPTTKP